MFKIGPCSNAVACYIFGKRRKRKHVLLAFCIRLHHFDNQIQILDRARQLVTVLWLRVVDALSPALAAQTAEEVALQFDGYGHG